MVSLERKTRRIAKTKFLKLRNTKDGITIYHPNGVDKETFSDWESVYNFVQKYDGI